MKTRSTSTPGGQGEIGAGMCSGGDLSERHRVLGRRQQRPLNKNLAIEWNDKEFGDVYIGSYNSPDEI